MFQKIFSQTSQIQFNGQFQTAKFSISNNEKSVVLWLQHDGNRFFTLDKLGNNWKTKEQHFSISGLIQPSGIHLNENGTILIMYDVTKRYIYTWLRAHVNSNWLLRNILDLMIQPNAKSDINCFFFKNQIFIDCNAIFFIIKRINQNFKMVNKMIYRNNDVMNCLTYGYEKDVLAEVTDSVIYFWRENKTTWDKEKTASYDCQFMPHYSCFQENEVKAFVNGAVWMISYPEREDYQFQDNKITERTTQSSLNYFFQLDAPTQNQDQYINFWYRENQQQRNFCYEKLNLSATHILLGRNGNVFVAIKIFEQYIKLQIYESLPFQKQFQQEI